MQKIYFLFIFLFSTYCFSQNLDWFYFLTQGQNVYSGNFQNSNRVYSIAIDDEENVYMVGSYQENLGVDPNNPTVLQLISANGTESNQCYLVKIDKNKNYLWHKTISIGLNSNASIHSIAIDINGDVIIAGSAGGNNINLNPDSSAPILYSTDNYLQNALFLNKYSKTGDFIFGNFYKGGTGIPKVILDTNSNIFLTGQYTNYFAGHNTDFDLSAQNYYLTGGHGSAFILKNDKNGSFLQAKFLEGGKINAIQFDNSGNLVLFGNSGRVNFNNETTFINPSTGTGGGDYLLKIDKTISPIWFQSLGGQDIYSNGNDSKPFDIDTDNSIVASTTRSSATIIFPNKIVEMQNPLMRAVIFKIDKNGNYIWHSTLEQTESWQSTYPVTVSIASDRTINWTTDFDGVNLFKAVGENTEQIVGGLSYAGTYTYYQSLLKLNTHGKLIYNKHKILTHGVSRIDKTNNKMYFAGQFSARDPNPDFLVNGQLPHIPGVKAGAYIVKLDKCYSGTPDGEPYFYTCISAQKRIKDLHPKTSYSSWYDSPTSTTPLSPETILTTKKYYAETQDVSCPNNPTRLEVDVKIFQNPPKLVVPDFTFCNLAGKRLLDLKINNNQDVEFFDEDLNPLSILTIIVANKKYFVQQSKTYSYYAKCWSEFAGFYVYDTSIAPTAASNQSFCKISNPKISDIAVTGINLKWYDFAGTILPEKTLLQDQTKYYVSQTSGTCESAKAEITIQLIDPDPPIGNANQHFCSAQNATLADIQISGTAIKWYNLSGISLPVTTLLADGEIYFATQTINNCESTQKLQVKININANAVAGNDYSETFCDDDTDNLKSLNLNDYRSRLVVDFQNYSFDFYAKNGQSVSNEVIISLGLTEFAVKITSALGCYKTVKLSFTLNPKPQLHLPPKLEFCEGLPVILDAGSGFKTYLWSTGEKTQTISTDQEGTYSVTVTNSFDCSNTGSIPVTKSITATIKNITIVNNTATITMSEVGEYLYSLDHMNWQSSNVFSNLENRTYTVSIKTTAGCMLGIENFTIFSVPNSFTPNADGINDHWTISGLENYVNSEITIVDKNGREVLKTLINGKFKWDGKLLGRPLPTDVYWYLIKISDGRILQGSVLLKNRN